MMNEKLYEKFSSNERIDLVISAFARGDHEEIARLRRACPEYTYTAKDLKFTFAFDKIVKVFSVFCLICATYSNKVLLIRSELTAVIATYDLPNKDEYSVINDLDEQIDITHRMQIFLDFVDAKNNQILQCLSYVKSAYDAFEQFCKTVDINYEHIRKWLKIQPVEALPVGADKSSIELAISKPEVTLEIKELFLSYWK